jgi:hypothetical protein
LADPVVGFGQLLPQDFISLDGLAHLLKLSMAFTDVLRSYLTYLNSQWCSLNAKAFDYFYIKINPMIGEGNHRIH